MCLRGQPSLKHAGEVEDQRPIERHENSTDRPSECGQQRPVGERAHHPSLSGELEKGNNGQWQLETKDDLAQDDQLSRAFFAVHPHHDHGGDNGDEARDEEGSKVVIAATWGAGAGEGTRL